MDNRLKMFWWPLVSQVTKTSFIIDKTVWKVWNQQQENLEDEFTWNKLKAKKWGFRPNLTSDNFSPAFSEWRQAEDEEIIGLLNEINDVQYNELHISETSAAHSAQQESPAPFLTHVSNHFATLFKKSFLSFLQTYRSNKCEQIWDFSPFEWNK